MREKKYDIVKGIAIILMIFCHIVKIRPIRIWVYSFHMPLFFIVSGYFFREKGIAEQAKSSFRGIMIPYICTILLCVVRTVLLCLIQETPLNGLKNFLIAALFGIGYMREYSYSIGPMWFLPCMFMARMLFEGILQVCKRTRSRVIASLAVGCAGLLIGQAACLPYSFDVAMVSVIFMLYGYYAQRIEEFISKTGYAMPFYIVLGVLTGITYVYCYQENTHTAMLQRLWPLGLLAIITAIVVSQALTEVVKHVQDSAVCQIFEVFGRRSLFVLCAHVVISEFPVSRALLMRIGLNLDHVNTMVWFIFTLLLVILYFKLKKEQVVKLSRSGPSECAATGNHNAYTAMGVAMIFLVISISGVGEVGTKLIAGFLYPLIFLCLGYCTDSSETGLSGFIKRAAKTYLLPYFVLVGLNLSVICVKNAKEAGGLNAQIVEELKTYALNALYSNASSKTMPGFYTLWFLTAAFVASVFAHLILSRKKRWCICLGVCLCFGGAIVFTHISKQMPWHFDSAFSGCILMLVGVFMRNYISSLHMFDGIIGIFAGMVCIISNDVTAIVAGNLGNPLIFYPGAILVSAGVFVLCDKIPKVKHLPVYGKGYTVILGVSLLVRERVKGISVIWNSRFRFLLMVLLILLAVRVLLEIWFSVRRYVKDEFLRKDNASAP